MSPSEENSPEIQRRSQKERKAEWRSAKRAKRAEAAETERLRRESAHEAERMRETREKNVPQFDRDVYVQTKREVNQIWPNV